jgi:hypothetical protein
VVLAEDPRRTEAALDRWLPMTQAWLVVHTGPPGQQASQAQLTARAPSPQALSRVKRLTCGRDTLGQITCLAVALRRWRQTPGGPVIGSVILVTGQEHLSRALAIAQIVLGGQGLTVTGFPADTQGVPEDPLRIHRDRLRAQLWRATGWDGRPPLIWLPTSWAVATVRRQISPLIPPISPHLRSRGGRNLLPGGKLRL